MNRRRLLATMLSAPIWAGPLWGCSGSPLLVPAATKAAASASIDGDPLSVLPSGALLMWRIDGPALFASPLGGHVSNIMTSLLPLGPDSGFVPARDIQRVYGALYALQGTDTCAVLQGSYDVAAIEQSAQVKARTGTAVVETLYAGRTMYTMANLGFVALTPNTLMTGNETGLRRALDRLRYGEDATAPPAWMKAIFDDPSAPLALVGDVREHGALAAAQERLPFVDGLLLIRALGNFQAPGLNIVGNLNYRDDQTAANGASTFADARKMLAMVAALGGGIAPEIETQHLGASVAFASQVDTKLAVLFLSMLNKVLLPGWDGQLF